LTEQSIENSDDVVSDGRVLVFIPTLNDEALLADLASQVAGLGGEFIPLVLDDGSKHKLPPASLPARCLLFSLPDNMGLGVCTHIAIDHALAHGYGTVVRIDADGQHPVASIPELLAPLRSGEADIVGGQRVNHKGVLDADSLLRRFVKAYIRKLASLATRGRAPSDVNTGFFAANPMAMHEINGLQLERYPEPQMFIQACRAGIRVREVPIRQLARQHGDTTLNYLQGARMIYRISILVLSELLRIKL
jgi:glycosyltransferase involved in cell wall biosynthesis